MDFGNIIFIGLIVIAVISNVAKAAKKAQASQSKPLVEQPVTEVTQTTQTRRNKPKLIKSTSVARSPIFVEGERQIFVEEKNLTTETVEIAKEYNFSDIAEIRKGIIFSEIFNRKY